MVPLSYGLITHTWQAMTHPDPSHEIHTRLTSYLTVPADSDREPPHTVNLDHVPAIDIHSRKLVMPDHGITMHYGTRHVLDILKRRINDALTNGDNFYEVKASVKVGSVPPLGNLRVDQIPQMQVLNLPRAGPDASVHLKGLIAVELDGVFGADADDISIAAAVSQHPRLLDALAQHSDLRHVAIFVWQSALPTSVSHNGHGGDATPLVLAANLATLYIADPERVALETLNADWITACLPPWVGFDGPSLNDVVVDGVAKHRSGPRL